MQTSPSSVCLTSIQHVGAEDLMLAVYDFPVTHKFHAIKRRLSKWGSGTPEEPYSEDKPSLLLRLCQHGPPSHSLSRFLSYFGSLASPLTSHFLYFYIDFLSNLGHAHPHHPLLSLLTWSGGLFLHVRKENPHSGSRAVLRSAAGSEWGFNL